MKTTFHLTIFASIGKAYMSLLLIECSELLNNWGIEKEWEREAYLIFRSTDCEGSDWRES